MVIRIEGCTPPPREVVEAAERLVTACVRAGVGVKVDWQECDYMLDGTLLSSFIPNTHLRTLAVQLLGRCEKPADILSLCVPVFTGACCLTREVVRSAAFCRAILPHLTALSSPSVDNIRSAMRAV